MQSKDDIDECIYMIILLNIYEYKINIIKH